MEGVSAAVYRGIKGYWRRKGYDRLNGGRKRKVRVVQLDLSGVDGSAKQKRFWRVKLARRLKVRLRFSPKKFLLGLRDAYVSMMMKIANSSVIGSVYGGGATVGFGVRPLKEYDERMIVEIYKSILMAEGQLVPRDTSLITCQR